MTIKLYNTRTRAKEDFAPIDPANVRMYVCGPTVYDRAHLGNARPVVVFDVLYRLLRHEYGADHVTYVRNFTDVDDKINARAAESGRQIGEITAETTQWFLDDMAALGALEPDHMPRATQYIPQMVAMIEDLIAKGHAYEKESHVLFRVRSYEKYGTLSGRSVDDMIAGARVEIAPFKEDPMDFVLWKPSDAQTPGWDSPWGRGRPGWHIECSAMARELLGERFDIHGGGNDLMFPHHENEIAQSCCANDTETMANVWMHNEMLQVDGKKMSKSLGNFFTVRDLLDEYDREFGYRNIGPAIRLRLLQTHYRSPVDAGSSYVEASVDKLSTWWFWTNPWLEAPPSGDEKRRILSGSPFLQALCDDLNTSLAISEIDRQVQKFRATPEKDSIINESADSKIELAKTVYTYLEFLGFEFAELEWLSHSRSQERRKKHMLENNRAEALIKELIELRSTARKNRNFHLADKIRDGLQNAGVTLKDSPGGVAWELLPDFDPSKLEALK